MASRYDSRQTAINSNTMYKGVFNNRGLKHINQFRTGKLRYPTSKEISNLVLVSRTWRQGDHYYKLANEYYNSPTYWWVIAHFNQKPLESDIEFGDVIRIPTPLELVLSYIGV